MKDFDPLAVDVPRLLAVLGIPAQHEGDRWVACCPHPDHKDSHPSWDIKDTPGQSRHGLHHCLSCKWEGTATELVVDLLNISFQGAREYIVERAMGSSAMLQSVAMQVSLAGNRSFKLPPEAIIAPLRKWPEIPRRYVTGKRRQITAEQVAKWKLGYAVKGSLAGRIIVPAYDYMGVLMSYTARTFTGSPKRYREPKRIEGAHDGAIFGEQFWPPPKQRNIVVVTEGAFNALAVERVAPTLPLASLFGSNVHLRHLSKISTFHVALVVTDPDAAGDRAAEKLRMALRRHIRLIRVRLKPTKDMDKTDANSVPPELLRQALERAWCKFKGMRHNGRNG